MALRGANISANFDDVVHVNQSGAGLADHAGAEAALYVDDGAGGVDQICGRTAVRHWLDPHPDAASFDETWEFSTTGDMTQAALETAGWTFTNCTAEVANGLLVLTSTTNAIMMASLGISFAGDFDFCVTPVSPFNYNPGVYSGANISALHGAAGIADYRAGVEDVAHYGVLKYFRGYSVVDSYMSGAYTTLGGTPSSGSIYGGGSIIRVYRYSSTVEVCGAQTSGIPQWFMVADDTTPENNGFTLNTSASDSSTFNKLFLTHGKGAPAAGGAVIAFASIRRFQ